MKGNDQLDLYTAEMRAHCKNLFEKSTLSEPDAIRHMIVGGECLGHFSSTFSAVMKVHENQLWYRCKAVCHSNGVPNLIVWHRVTEKVIAWSKYERSSDSELENVFDDDL